MAGHAELVWDLKCQLGEGPVWIAEDKAVWFVDIKTPAVHCFEPETGEKRTWPAPEPVSFLAPVAGGGFIVGLKSGLAHFDPGTGAFGEPAPVEPDRPDNRLNDGFVDPKGRIWFGSMDEKERRDVRTGALWRRDPDRRLLRMDGGYAITNGPAMSPDGRVLYHVGTLDRVIWAFDISPDGALANKREFIRITRPGAHPDGLIVDAEGCLWIALFGGWGVDRYSPLGDLVDRLELPVANCTKPCFGGPDLKTLYITTAWLHLKPEEREQQPTAGGLYAAQMEVAGLKQNYISR